MNPYGVFGCYGPCPLHQGKRSIPFASTCLVQKTPAVEAFSLVFNILYTAVAIGCSIDFPQLSLMGNIMLITIEQLLHKSNVLCAAIQSNSVGNYQEAARQLEALRASVPMKFISEKI